MAQEVKLMEMRYADGNKVHIRAYADLVAYKQEGAEKVLVAAHIGGYTEAVQGMAMAIKGGGTVTVRHGTNVLDFRTAAKRYDQTLSKEGLYTETLLRHTDDMLVSLGNDAGSKKPLHRLAYLFCAPDDPDSLFRQVDDKTIIPLLPSFREYLLGELKRRRILVPLHVLSTSRAMEGWMLQLTPDDANVAAVVEEGLRTGAIKIPGAKQEDSGFSDVSDLQQYIERYASFIGEMIQARYAPLFDPRSDSLCDGILKVNRYIQGNAGYALYPAQLAAAEALARRLKKHRAAILVGECGSGKTKTGAAAIAALGQGHKQFCVVMCPSHVAAKWVREVEESVPGAYAQVAHSISDVDQLHTRYQKGTRSVFCILSKERARDGAMKRPAVRYSRTQRGFVCPDCGARLMIDEDGLTLAGQFLFARETSDNHRCQKCGGILWTCINPNDRRARYNEWVKIPNYGFVYRPRLYEHYHEDMSSSLRETLDRIAEREGEYIPIAGAYRRYPLSSYIKRRMGRIHAFIADELHQFKGDSGQGEAMAELAGIAHRTVGMTATLVSGYAEGLFYLFYRLFPHLMVQDGQSFGKASGFGREYGVTETEYVIDHRLYKANRRSAARQVRTRQKPGISPLVYTRFLLDTTVFLSLSDIARHLPEYEEIPVQLQLPKEVETEYRRMECLFQKTFRGQGKEDRIRMQKLLSQYLGLMSVYPDQPYGHAPILDPVTKDVYVAPRDTAIPGTANEKDRAVLDIVRRKVAAGERVLIYTNWVRTDTQEKLLGLLTQEGYYAEVLPSTVPPSKREAWVKKHTSEGLQVLICNPQLIETGLDLLDFTAIVYYNVGYSLFGFRQASRRSWRINQTAPRIEVYILYYANTMQHRAIRLMANKLSVATLLEGNFTEAGLAAMSDCDDLTSALVRDVMEGIKEDANSNLAEIFRSMAITHEETVEEAVRGTATAEIDMRTAHGQTQDAAAYETHFRVEAAGISQHIYAAYRAKHRRAEAASDWQPSLFDLSA